MSGVSSAARSDVVNIRCLGCNSIYDSSSVFRRAATGEYMIMLTKSRCRFDINGLTMRVPQDAFIICDGRLPVVYSAEDCPLICDWICFDGEDEKEFIDALELVFNRPVLFADTDFIGELMRNIASEFYSLASRRAKMLENLMRLLLVKAGDAMNRGGEKVQTSEPHYAMLIELREKIYRNPQMKWNVDTMAAYVSMSRSYFQHLYRETFGVSCIADVISGKIEKAKGILTETGCTVSQVAAMCGYDNEEHFMRQFKKIVGVTPTRYRKQV